jgi:hypothetical protein
MHALQSSRNTLMMIFLLGASLGMKDQPLSGAIFTTLPNCEVVNANTQYTSKCDVYLNGGPAHPGAAGLPDGSYYVMVTDPSGKVILGSSLGSGNDAPIQVMNGAFAQCYQLWALVIKGSDGSQGFDDTPNPGMQYKVWVSSRADFPENQSKTDAFKAPDCPCDCGGGGDGGGDR